MNKTTTLNSDSYGERIGLEEANSMIKEYTKLNALITRTIPSPSAALTASDHSKVTELNNTSYNAFIFTKDLIQRFFDGSETDANGNPKMANFLMVILGAHPVDKEIVGSDPTDRRTFKAGSFTVLTAGCERAINPDGSVSFYALNVPQPANEYPPNTAMAELITSPGGSPQTIKFLIV